MTLRKEQSWKKYLSTSVGKELSCHPNCIASFLIYPFAVNQGFIKKLQLLCYLYFDVIVIHQSTQ